MAGGKRKKYDDIHMTPDVSYITNPDVAHEESDVAVGPIAKFVLGLFIFSVVTCALMYLLFYFFERRAVRSERRASPLARRDQNLLRDEPRLQVAPGFVLRPEDDPEGVLSPRERDFQLREPQAEYRAVRRIWDHELNSYGWEDQAAGTARVPIDRAIGLYLQKQRQKAGAPQPAAGAQTPPAASPPSQQPPSPAPVAQPAPHGGH